MKEIYISPIIAVTLFLMLLEFPRVWGKYDIASGILVKYGVIIDVFSLLLLIITKHFRGKYWKVVVYVSVAGVQFLYWNPYSPMSFCCFVFSIIVLVLYLFV